MSPKPYEFSKHLAELESITSWFESSDADLDQGIAKFERGMELAQELRQHLQLVENRVEKIRARYTTEPNETVVEPSDSDTDDQTNLF
ncbi:exodeoxyribonuclease VII small subunit [bacterium]|nr:MAG: exodeoxyribonuclease VII small subunit [bacterium]